MRLLKDPGQLRRAVVFNLETADVAENLRHQLHIVVLHRLQLDFLLLLVSLGETETLREGSVWRDGGCVCPLMTVRVMTVFIWTRE